MMQNFKDYKSPFPIVRFYFRKIMSILIEMLNNVEQDALILDFGCGRQYFKKTSSFKNVIGYDIVPEFSDVSDYSTLKPDIILCNHTLEDFKRMKPKFIITGIPTENMISKACAMIGKPHGYFEHKTGITRIHREMTKRFNLLSRKNVMTLTVVSKWQ